MNHSYFMLATHYDRLWAALVPTPSLVDKLTKICERLRSHQSVYEEASVAVWGKPDYWWYVAITDQMEGGGGAKTYLGNGQRLDRVTTEVPAGRGPFGTFVEGCVDALRGVPAPTSISQAAYNWEGFNGWGYLSKLIEDPYLASWSNQYSKGKFVADHEYDPEAVSDQPGALTLLKVLGVPMGPHDPLPPQKLPSTTTPSTESPMVQTVKGHVMVDVTQIETEVNYALNIAEQVIPFATMLIPGFGPVGALLTQVIKGVRTVEAQMGLPTSAAVVAATSHNTPGAPNAGPLNGPA